MTVADTGEVADLERAHGALEHGEGLRQHPPALAALQVRVPAVAYGNRPGPALPTVLRG
jgi:hypothetical protein